MIRIVKYFLQHPLGKRDITGTLFRFIFWQLQSRISDQPILKSYVGQTKLSVRRGMTGATGNIYLGLHEFHDMGFVLHFLRPTDYFLDIGANVGSYTVLASGVVGSNSIAFEPSPATFSYLNENLRINQLQELVRARNTALGAENGKLSFTTHLDTTNHISVGDERRGVEVEVEKLDEVIRELKIEPALIKMDVEGFETEVLKGAKDTVRNASLKAIIIELNGSGSRYGFDELAIHSDLLNNGFLPYRYEPFERALTKVDHFGTHNTIYIRDISFVEDRVKSAPPFQVLNWSI